MGLTGALGDQIIASPLFKVLKEKGFHVTYHCNENSKFVNRNNPYIDETIIYEDDSIPNEELPVYWDKISKGYDKFINLTGSLETSLVKEEGKSAFYWSKEKRHKECDVNFYDNALAVAGYPEIKGLNADLYFTRLENTLARQYRDKYKDKFLIMWSLSGSAIHKVWPFTEIIARAFLAKHPDAMILTVGDLESQLLEWSNSVQTKCYSGKWSFRKSMVMAKYVDLVIGSDTGLMHAVGSFDTPKILMLSSNTEENLSKYWKNCVNLSANVLCQPCHQLHYTLNSCPHGEKLLAVDCMGKLKGPKVYNEIKKTYNNWMEKKNGTFCRDREQAVLCG